MNCSREVANDAVVDDVLDEVSMSANHDREQAWDDELHTVQELHQRWGISNALALSDSD